MRGEYAPPPHPQVFKSENYEHLLHQQALNNMGFLKVPRQCCKPVLYLQQYDSLWHSFPHFSFFFTTQPFEN